MKKNFYIFSFLLLFPFGIQSVLGQTVTRDFSTDPGWTGSGNTSQGNSYGYLSGSQAIGGYFSRASTNSYYASLAIGSYTSSSTLVLSGKFKLDNNNYDGAFGIGFFDKDDVGIDNFFGIQVQEPTSKFGPMRIYVKAGTAQGTTLAADLNVEHTFNLTYNGSSGVLSGTLMGQPVTVTKNAGTFTFNAFGLMNFAFNNTVESTGMCEFDDLTYTSTEVIDPIDPEPNSVNESIVDNTTVYPSVTSDMIYFNNLPDNGSVVLVDMVGRSLLVKNAAEVKSGLSLASYASGMYLVQVLQGQEIVKTLKVLKK
jgi:hypothetical protein